jgi:hypothetical protein
MGLITAVCFLIKDSRDRTASTAMLYRGDAVPEAPSFIPRNNRRNQMPA